MSDLAYLFPTNLSIFFFFERCPPKSDGGVRVLEMTDVAPAQCEYTVIYWTAGTHQHKHLSYGNLVCPSEFFLFHLASFLRPLPAAGVSAIMMTPFHKKEAGCQKQEHALRPQRPSYGSSAPEVRSPFFTRVKVQPQ